MLALTFLAAAFLVSLWILAFVERVPWVPLPAGGGQFGGLANALFLSLLRWAALLAAFLFLSLDGRLSGWAPHWTLRALLIGVGITLLEGLLFYVELRSAGDKVSPLQQQILASTVVLLPLAVIAGGYLGSRALFAAGIAGAVAAAVWPIPAYTPPPPDESSVEYILHHVDPQAEPAEVLARLDGNRGWHRKVARELDGGWKVNAALLLTMRPTELGEGDQEKCWRIALGSFASVKPHRDWGENWMPSEFRSISRIVHGLASVPGPVRDRHAADFRLVRDYVDFYRNQTPETRHPELADLVAVDWTAARP